MALTIEPQLQGTYTKQDETMKLKADVSKHEKEILKIQRKLMFIYGKDNF